MTEAAQPGPAPRGQDGRIRVAVLFGGRSSEHAVSCVTAAGVLRAMDRRRYDVVPIGITRSGQWVQMDDARVQAFRLDGGPLPAIEDAHATVVTAPGAGSHELLVTAPGEPPRSLGAVDVVFPLLHGPFGEDGTIQGLLDLLGVPYVGAGVLASAVGMDKDFMKIVFEHAGLPVGPYEAITERQWAKDRDGCLERVGRLGLPVFVKPARAGSSMGISRVTDPAALEAAIETAREHDPKVVVEAGIVGREIECAVLDQPGPESPVASLPGEIVVADGQHAFYDFDAKYVDVAAAQLSCPADLPAEAGVRIRQLAVAAFEAIGAEGLSRVDFFYTPEGDLLVNEINTMPGFTPISMYPQMWAATGIDYPELIDRLLQLALGRSTGLR